MLNLLERKKKQMDEMENEMTSMFLKEGKRKEINNLLNCQINKISFEWGFVLCAQSEAVYKCHKIADYDKGRCMWCVHKEFSWY